MITGKITRISGPIVYASGLDQCGLYDVVHVGQKKLIGEIIRQNKGNATIQVYEDDTGMKIGEDVFCTEKPLSLKLGPGLIGKIYDGIQRPLKDMYEEAGAFLLPGQRTEPLELNKKFHFVPDVHLDSEIYGGMAIGHTQETTSVLHKIMVPPKTSGTKITFIAQEGDYTVDEIIAKTDEGEEISMAQYWPLRVPRPFAKKLEVDEPLITGQRVIDVFFPLSKGGTAAIPGGFGTGKTMTQHAVAKYCDADIIVYIGCGERGNEMTDVLSEFPELIDPRTGRSLMERTILIANTSNMPVAAREVSLYSGITLAEYYRDMGLDVAIMADSTSRWAEALRELSGRMEEMPAEEGFPAYLPTRLAEFYERAGKVTTFENQQGSVSVIGAVSPPGGDFSEPVTQHTKRFIRCFWALERELANARHYPAIGWIDSYSEYADEVKGWWNNFDSSWYSIRLEALELLKKENRLEQIVKLVGADSLPSSDRLILITAEMIKNGFLQQNAFDEVDCYSVPEKQIALLLLIMNFHKKSLELLKAGCPLVKIMNLSVREEIIKAKSEIPNNDLAGIKTIASHLDDETSTLLHIYQQRESI